MNEMKIAGYTIISTPFIRSFVRVKRTWRERLKSGFFKKYKEVDQDEAIIVDNWIFVSPRVYAKLEKHMTNPYQGSDLVQNLLKGIRNYERSKN